MNDVWGDGDMISEWLFTMDEMKIKAGGIGKMIKGHRSIWKSIRINCVVLYLGYRGLYDGGILCRNIAKYSGVYNKDTNISGMISNVLLMKVKNGIPDEEGQWGDKLTKTVARCSNLVGQRYVCLTMNVYEMNVV